MNGVPNQRARVLELAITPLGLKEIAWKLGITKRTVRYHLENIFRENGCRDRLELICKFLGGKR